MRRAYHDPLAKSTPSIDISDAWMNMHPDWRPILHKYLFQKHSRNLTRLDVCVGYKMPVWSISTGPTESETFFFSCAGLDEDITLPWDFRFDPPTEGLGCLSLCKTFVLNDTDCYGFTQFCLGFLGEVLLNEEFYGEAIVVLKNGLDEVDFEIAKAGVLNGELPLGNGYRE